MLPNSGTPQPAIEVYDGQGNQVGQPLSGNFAGVDVIKPAAGAYTVLATDSSKTPGASSFTLDLLRTVNACSVPAAQGSDGERCGLCRRCRSRRTVSRPPAAMCCPCAAVLLLPTSRRRWNSTTLTACVWIPAVFSLSRKAAATGNYTVILGAATPRTAGGYSFAWQRLNQAGRRGAARLRRFDDRRALAQQSVPLLHARRRRRRHTAAAAHPHQRQFLAADGSLRPCGREDRGQFRRHTEGRRRRQLPGGDWPVLRVSPRPGPTPWPSSVLTTPVRRCR